MVPVIISGASGRMGRDLLKIVIESQDYDLVGALVRQGSGSTGIDAGKLLNEPDTGLILCDNVNDINTDGVFIDFTTPSSTIDNVNYCAKRGFPMVIGTTGLGKKQKSMIEYSAKYIPIVFAANFSAGIAFLFKILRDAAKVFGDRSDIEIIESHHKHKVDSPSGTALAMGSIIANELDKNLSDIGIFNREGEVGPRPKGRVGFSAIRGGEVVGDHTTMFFCEGETITLSHSAINRRTFSMGALRAATWVQSTPPGLYSMNDVLNLS